MTTFCCTSRHFQSSVLCMLIEKMREFEWVVHIVCLSVCLRADREGPRHWVNSSTVLAMQCRCTLMKSRTPPTSRCDRQCSSLTSNLTQLSTVINWSLLKKCYSCVFLVVGYSCVTLVMVGNVLSDVRFSWCDTASHCSWLKLWLVFSQTCVRRRQLQQVWLNEEKQLQCSAVLLIEARVCVHVCVCVSDHGSVEVFVLSHERVMLESDYYSRRWNWTEWSGLTVCGRPDLTWLEHVVESVAACHQRSKWVCDTEKKPDGEPTSAVKCKICGPTDAECGQCMCASVHAVWVLEVGEWRDESCSCAVGVCRRLHRQQVSTFNTPVRLSVTTAVCNAPTCWDILFLGRRSLKATKPVFSF